jgi:nitrite reductase (NO-forming)
MRTIGHQLKATASVLALTAAIMIAAPSLARADEHSHGAPAGATETMPGVVNIVRNPADLPPPIAKRGPAHVDVNLVTSEVTGQLDDGTSYKYWTFNGKVPGPFIRVRAGDTVDVHLTNAEDSLMQHNVDFHAVTGPGGGGMATEALPGESKGFRFKALNPGLYVYHCATPMVAQHISNGMYGMILVEPAEGLRKVDREFYVMQGEIYTEQPIGTRGEQMADVDKLVNEHPEYFVFNGAVGALSGVNALHAQTGETIRLFFGVGGPNFTSSFHVIGEIFDRVYPMGSVTSNTVNDVQTVTVPPGGAVIGEMKLEVPGKYVLVDHALSRLNKGLAGFLDVTGPQNATTFKPSLDEKLSAAH